MTRFWLFAFALILAYPAFGGVRVVVPNHDIARGQVIGESDMIYAQANGPLMAGIATSLGEVVGLEARRTLHAGETLRQSDLRRPVMVVKGSTVTMTFEAPGIVLTATGRAMSEGGLGETVTIQNPASYRQISGVVIGPGQVRAQVGGAIAGPVASNRFAAIHP
jgi:flagellar basal body P-ring formation protein FlgA